MGKIKAFVKKEKVLVLAFICAVISCFFVKPNLGYIDYIDFRTLGLLFCLMTVSVGLEACGFTSDTASFLMRKCKSTKSLVPVLVLLPFFVSMLVTNDVALIAFVPFAITVLELSDARKLIIPVVVMQTLAANLGSMATPVGNPQNLFLYSKYDLSAGEFFKTVLPFAGISLVLVTVVSIYIGVKGRKIASKSSDDDIKLKEPTVKNRKLVLIVCTVLFVLCLLSVFKFLDWRILTVIALIIFLIIAPKELLKVDYCLLLTFICFFIFSGNIGKIDAVKNFVSDLMTKNAFFTSLCLSQVISNVPAAVLLSGFTDNFRDLLLGTDIGGLGTPIASLASLISLKLYSKSEGSNNGKYLAVFMLTGVAFLLVLIAAKLYLPCF